MLKRLFDICFSFLALTALTPVLLVVSLYILLVSPGPVFFRGVRTGKDGKPFRIFKFRTMIMGAEQLGGGTTANNDPRLIRGGQTLRKFKLDELPQFINVLIGDMSVVGPRPELPAYTDKYTEEERIILSIRPGITDFSSIEFSDLQNVVGSHNADEAYEEKVLPIKNQLRMKYVKEHSFALDVKLIALTVLKLLKVS